MDPELYKAAITGSSEKLTEDIYLGQVTSQNNTVLHVAAKCGQRKVAEEVLYSNSELLHVENARGNTALHIAARLGHVEMVRLLVNRAKEVELELEMESGSGPTSLLLARAANARGDTALHEAVRGSHYEVAVLLIDEDRDVVGCVNADGESPLFLAVDRGFYRVVLHMLEASPKCSYAGRNGMNALHAAVIRTHHSNQFKSYSKKSLALWTKFHYISLLVEKILYVDKYICLAFKFLRSDYKLNMTGVDFVGKVLQKCPSSMVEADEFGWIPLHYAAHLGNVEVVELFLEINRNSIVYIKDKEGMSALHIAAREGRVGVMRSIIERCPDTCELLDDRERTALHVTVENRKKSATKFLLGTLAFQDLINDQDWDGNTPLHLAAFQGHSEILEMLAKDSRVDKGALNNAGMTIIDIVRSSKKPMDIDILKTLSMATLQTKGALPSLEQKVAREISEPQKIYIDEDERVQDMQVKLGHCATNNRKQDELYTNSQGHAASTTMDFKNTAGINLLVSTIIAMVTFAAAFSMPGGYNVKGEAISSGKKSFKMFLLFDSLAFGCSAASMFVHFLVAAWPARLCFVYPIYCVTVLTELSLVGIALAFVHGSLAVFPENSELANLATNSVLLSFSIPVVYFGLRIGYKAYQLFKGFSAPSKKGGRRKNYKCLH